MSKPILSLLLCGALLPVVVAGCRKDSPPEAIEIKTYTNGWKTEDTDYVRFRTPLLEDQGVLMREMEALLKAKDYAAIEKRVAEYRRTKEEFLNGITKLQVAYMGLGWVPGSEADWRAKNQLLQQWRKKHPQSLTAQIALASNYIAGVWFVKNSGHNAVERDRLWKQRWKAMGAVFNESYRSGKPLLEWLLLAQQSVNGYPDSRKTFDKFTQEAVNDYGNVTQVHLYAVQNLTQINGGKPGQWQAYAAKIANQLKGEAGDRFYAQAVWFLPKGAKSKQSADLKSFDWPRAKRGFELLMNENPQNPESVAGPYAVAAWHARDRQTLKLLFEKHIGKRIDNSAWETISDFLAARRWAMRKE